MAEGARRRPEAGPGYWASGADSARGPARAGLVRPSPKAVPRSGPGRLAHGTRSRRQSVGAPEGSYALPGGPGRSRVPAAVGGVTELVITHTAIRYCTTRFTCATLMHGCFMSRVPKFLIFLVSIDSIF